MTGGFFAQAPYQQITDPRMQPATHPLPFDGKRLIYGGFRMLLEA